MPVSELKNAVQKWKYLCAVVNGHEGIDKRELSDLSAKWSGVHGRIWRLWTFGYYFIIYSLVVKRVFDTSLNTNILK
jgi:hypothetical protein